MKNIIIFLIFSTFITTSCNFSELDPAIVTNGAAFTQATKDKFSNTFVRAGTMSDAYIEIDLSYTKFEFDPVNGSDHIYIIMRMVDDLTGYGCVFGNTDADNNLETIKIGRIAGTSFDDSSAVEDSSVKVDVPGNVTIGCEIYNSKLNY